MIWNVLAKTLLSTTVDAVKHWNNKREKRRAIEIELQTEIQKEHIKASKDSFKDEIILAFFLFLFSLPLWGQEELLRKWIEVIKELPDFVWYIFTIMVSASFGVKITDTVLKRRK